MFAKISTLLWGICKVKYTILLGSSLKSYLRTLLKTRFGLKEKIRVMLAGKVVETRQGGEAFSPIQEHRRGETMKKRARNRTSPVHMSYIFIQHYTGIHSLKETFTVTAEYFCHRDSHRGKGVFQQKGSISKEHFETFMSFFRGCCSCSEGSFAIDDGGFFRKIGPKKISHDL